jgi:hypothetical protein
MADSFMFPKTMEAIMERLVADLKSAVEKADTWRTIADTLVYTEHNDYAHQTMSAFERCERCAAHDKYHEQVSIEENP